MSELAKRIAVSAVLIPLVLLVLFFEGIPLLLILGIITLLGSVEFISMLRSAKVNIGWHWLPASAACYVGVIMAPDLSLLYLGGIMILALTETVFRWRGQDSVTLAAFSLFGAIYTGFLPGLLGRISLDAETPRTLLWLIIMIWSADSAAYFVGMKWGTKRNIFPMSPRKSLEGFLAGAVVPFLIAIILSLFRVYPDLLVLFMMAFAAGFFGQMGDLAESALKRFCGVKDSSRMFPGHGGILDRTDSVMLSGTFLYCVLSILTKVR